MPLAFVPDRFASAAASGCVGVDLGMGAGESRPALPGVANNVNNNASPQQAGD